MPCAGSTAVATAVSQPEGHGAHHSNPADDTPGDPVHCITAAPCVFVMAAEGTPGTWEAPLVSTASDAEPGRLSSVSRAPELPPPRV